MDTKNKWIAGGVILAAFILFICGFCRISNRLTYIEKTDVNSLSEKSIGIADSHTVAEQEFIMPYELFWGIDVKTGTYGRNNNSFWKVELKEKESGKKIYEWSYNASQVSDGENYFLNVKHPIKVNRGKTYTASIRSKDATGNSALAFYTSGSNVYKEGKLLLDGEEQNADLCLRIYGGMKDYFWSIFYVGMSAIVLGMTWWIVHRAHRGEPIDKMLEAVGIAFLYLLFLYIFSRENTGSFTDECDNIRGGMLIAKGNVLYRDYYTQHTPFGYYLCALFALLGACNIQQFRLLYYLLEAAVWAGIYYRHRDYYGRAKMLLLQLAQIVIILPMFFQASKILGDNIQGLCMVVLIMEYIRYWEDGELGKSRCMIAAACIFVSITSAFVSVFAIAPVAISVLVKEILIRRKKGSWKMKDFVYRYAFLAGVCVIPFVMMLSYFAYHHALRKMYLMAYQFNTMVYNKYQNEYGRVKWKPFVLGIKNYFNAINNNFNAMITASGNEYAVIQLLIAVGAVTALLLWGRRLKKEERFIPLAALFLCMCGNGTRSGTDFHSVGMWNAALSIIILLGFERGQMKKLKENKTLLICAAAAGCYFVQPYVAMIADHAVYYPEVVKGIDEEVIKMTKPGDKIFIDAFVHDSIYLLYKERYPVNRNCYMLPWYMDWFEYDTLEDLEKGRPEILIYNTDTEVYGQTDFCPDLNQAIQSRYERVSEGSIIWKLK